LRALVLYVGAVAVLGVVLMFLVGVLFMMAGGYGP